MALGRTRAVVLVGVEGHLVEVEAHIGQGLPSFALVGLPDTSLYESRDRVRAAIVNSAQPWPQTRITVNLSPASVPKRGSGFDLAIACAVLAAVGAVPAEPLTSVVLIGELGLDGRLRPIRGVLPAVLAAARAGAGRVVVPAANAPEARLVPGVEVVGQRSLRSLVARLTGEPVLDDLDDLGDPAPAAGGSTHPAVEPTGQHHKDLADVIGQETARWALELSAAGGHHLFLLGPPGAGKTMLAQRLPGLLPDLSDEEALEVTAVHSVAGALRAGQPLVRRPPYQAPHHSATAPAVIGGGSGLARPGAASLAHRGVLFLDEAPEFAPRVLDALREPLESAEITLNRVAGIATYPARFRLVLAANPCPCGMAYGKGLECTCPSMAKRRYLARLSGPLLDRIDLHLWLDPLGKGALLGASKTPESTAVVAERVHAAQARAAKRFAGTGWRCNAEAPAAELRRRWPLAQDAIAPLQDSLSSGALSMRGADRVLRVAWTIADLSGRPKPTRDEMEIAMTLRGNGVRAA